MGKGRFEACRCLVGSHFSDRSSILRFQTQQLKRLLHHSYESVEYYRELFDRHGFHPTDFRSFEDISRIPMSTKPEMLAAGVNRLIDRDLKPARLLKRVTSGSTGTPFPVYRSWFEDRFLRLLRLKKLHRLGLRLRDQRAYIRFSPPRKGLSRLITFTGMLGFFPLVSISPFVNPEDILAQISTLRPDVLQGYATIVHLVAAHVTDRAYGIRLRMVLVGGESLTKGMRKSIEAAFQCIVRQLYASHEFNLIALECPASNCLHVCEESVILEVLADGRSVSPGERGEVVVTALHSFAQPFIRFRLGDIVRLGQGMCSCGSPLLTLSEVTGRKADRIQLPGGRAASPFELFEYLTSNHAWVRQHQIIQESERLVVLKLVSSRPPEALELSDIESKMARLFGSDTSCRVDLVSMIPMEPGGKFRVSRSKVYSNYDDA